MAKKILLLVTWDLTLIFIDQLKILTLIMDQYVLKRPISHQFYVRYMYVEHEIMPDEVQKLCGIAISYPSLYWRTPQAWQSLDSILSTQIW